jgi:hypothetical protein
MVPVELNWVLVPCVVDPWNRFHGIALSEGGTSVHLEICTLELDCINSNNVMRM